MTQSWSIFIDGPVPTKGSYKPGKSGKMRPACDWLNEWTGRACCEVLASDPPTWQAHRQVSVQMQITVERPAGHFTAGKLNATGRKYDGPTRERDGDFDKHARAVFDMLQMADVLASDAQVVSPGPESWMQWCGPQRAPGVLITVADFVPVEPVARHLLIHHGWQWESRIDAVTLLCKPETGMHDIRLALEIGTLKKYEVTCRRCREMEAQS